SATEKGARTFREVAIEHGRHIAERMSVLSNDELEPLVGLTQKLREGHNALTPASEKRRASRDPAQPGFCRPAATPETARSSSRCTSGSTGVSFGLSRSVRRARSCRSESAST